MCLKRMLSYALAIAQQKVLDTFCKVWSLLPLPFNPASFSEGRHPCSVCCVTGQPERLCQGTNSIVIQVLSFKPPWNQSIWGI